MDNADSNDAPVGGHNIQIEEDKTKSCIQCDNQDDSDDDSSIGVPLITVAPDATLPAIREKVERPPEGLQWSDTAIVDCWNVAVKSHDNSEPPQWRSPSLVDEHDMEMWTKWRPKSVPIPLWAVDPFFHSGIP